MPNNRAESDTKSPVLGIDTASAHSQGRFLVKSAAFLWIKEGGSNLFVGKYLIISVLCFSFFCFAERSVCAQAVEK